MKLSETFASPESRVYAVILFVDMTESTSMKEKEVEATWLTTYGWFFDRITERVSSHGGQIVKYLGDGAMAVFDDEHAADAINTAIAIQEEIASARESHRVNLHCSIGIATGEVVRFETAYGEDYIGTVVDRAARLCAAASPKAVFVDKATIATALMRKVRSRLGEAKAPRRTVDEYQGVMQRIPLKGIAAPVEYHEILWDDQLYGVKSSAVPTGETRPTGAPSHNRFSAQPGAEVRQEQYGGTVRRWDQEKGNGFIVTESGEFFYTDKRFLAGSPDQLHHGVKVYFVALPPLIVGRNRVAAGLVSMGEELTAMVTRVHHTKRFGSVQVSDQGGNVHEIFLYIGEPASDLVRGSEVSVTISENEKGAIAVLQHSGSSDRLNLKIR